MKKLARLEINTPPLWIYTPQVLVGIGFALYLQMAYTAMPSYVPAAQKGNAMTLVIICNLSPLHFPPLFPPSLLLPPSPQHPYPYPSSQTLKFSNSSLTPPPTQSPNGQHSLRPLHRRHHLHQPLPHLPAIPLPSATAVHPTRSHLRHQRDVYPEFRGGREGEGFGGFDAGVEDYVSSSTSSFFGFWVLGFGFGGLGEGGKEREDEEG